MLIEDSVNKYCLQKSGPEHERLQAGRRAMLPLHAVVPSGGPEGTSVSGSKNFCNEVCNSVVGSICHL
jgi:hypothetical protein